MSGPWHVQDDTRRWQTHVVAVILLGASWYVAAGSTSPSSQVTSVAAGLGAAALAGSGEILWLLTGMRAVRDRKEDAAGRIEVLGPTRDASPTAAAPERRVAAPLVAVSGATLFHDMHCDAVAGKPVVIAGRSAHVRASRRPCAMCQR